MVKMAQNELILAEEKEGKMAKEVNKKMRSEVKRIGKK
jgi:hypothetical protein